MAGTPAEEDWLYHLPAFLDRVETLGAHDVVESVEAEVGGVLYHHRGARVPGHNATFVWHPEDGTFSLEIDAVGARSAWATFEADADWDFFLSRAPRDEAVLAWMADAEFAAEEADSFPDKAEAVGLGRFSFGLFLNAPDAWGPLEERAREVDAPFLIHRPSGRMLVPEGDPADYADVVPPELQGGEAPAHLGLRDVVFEA